MASPSRCLVDDLSNAADGDTLTLGERARHHLDHVRRLRVGDPVELRDGVGGAASGLWLGDGQVRIASLLPAEPRNPAPLWLAVAPPRLPRLGWLIEKATELGVERLLLLDVTHGQREVSGQRLERLQRKADAALLQCGRRHGMQLCGPLSLEAALASAPSTASDPGAPGNSAAGLTIWIADPTAAEPPPTERAEQPLLVLVGPEGGFSSDESAAALGAGARPVRLGPHILRVETAGLALAAWVAACAVRG